MTFSDCGDSTDPCIIEALTKNSMVGGFSPIKSVTSSSHLEVFKLPFTTTFDEIKAIFGKYGPIARVAMDFKCDESCLECYLTFVSESSTCDALNENERLIGSNKILVRKSTETDTTKGNKRLRTDDNPWDTTPAVASEGWGSSNPSTNATDSWGTSNDFSDGGNRGRRGRGRGGGGRGGGRSCFNCGEEGHVSWECFKQRGGRGGSRSCFSCGEEGHMSRECPKGPRTRSCFKCGEKGHMSRECPKPREGGGRGRGGRGRGGSGFNSSSSNNEWATSTSASNEDESKPQTLDW